MTDIDEILNGPDYFYCDFYRCRLSRAICRKRQTTGIEYEYNHLRIPEGCIDCAQGQTIKNGGSVTMETTTEQTGTDQTEPKKTRKQYHYIAPCKNCGRNLPNQGKGLCGGCRSVAKTAPPEQLEAALAAAKIRFNDPNFDGKNHQGQGQKKKLLAGLAAALSSDQYLPFPQSLPPGEGGESGVERVPPALDGRGQGEGERASELIETAMPQTCIPITLRLTVEISVRVNGIMG